VALCIISAPIVFPLTNSVIPALLTTLFYITSCQAWLAAFAEATLTALNMPGLIAASIFSTQLSSCEPLQLQPFLA
jgi:hypothetical protein